MDTGNNSSTRHRSIVLIIVWAIELLEGMLGSLGALLAALKAPTGTPAPPTGTPAVPTRQRRRMLPLNVAPSAAPHRPSPSAPPPRYALLVQGDLLIAIERGEKSKSWSRKSQTWLFPRWWVIARRLIDMDFSCMRKFAEENIPHYRCPYVDMSKLSTDQKMVEKRALSREIALWWTQCRRH